MSSSDDDRVSDKHAGSAPEPRIQGARVGQLVGVSPEGLPLVRFAGRSTPTPAQSFVALDDAQLRLAIEEQRQAVLIFEEDDPSRPLLVALAPTTQASSLLNQLLEEAAAPKSTGTSPPAMKSPATEERVVLSAQRELVLQVGEASITLRRDGTILLRGIRVESRASGLQLIRGGKIELN